VRVVLACVCGSDLWFYRGISELPHGGVGHEFIGVVDEVGSDVSDLAVGDFVISPFSWSDGTCRKVGRVGVPHDVEVDAEGTFYRNVGMRGGPAPARAYQPELLKQVLDGSINPGKVFDLTTDLEHISEAYAAMDERRAIKALIKVSER